MNFFFTFCFTTLAERIYRWGLLHAVDEVDILITILLNCKHDRDEIRSVIIHLRVFQHNFSFGYVNILIYKTFHCLFVCHM